MAAAFQTRRHGKLNGDTVSTLGTVSRVGSRNNGPQYSRSDRPRRDTAITSNHFSYTGFDMMIINGSCVVVVTDSVTGAIRGRC